jgi:monofunctional biosynthetic peptidoglycan transglycosylase
LILIKSSKLWRILLSLLTAIRRLVFITGLLVWLGISALALYIYQLFQVIPALETLTFAQVRSHAKTINVTRSINSQQNDLGNWADLNAVNRDLLYAIVLSEDSNFFNHNGIDYDALLAALAENIKTYEWRFGASTISQQTAKNLYLNNSKTFSRKLQEVLITYRLEDALSKNEILELYFNVVEFGPGLYGITNACAYYFKKSPADINAAEGAYLALLMPSPKKYHYTLFQNDNWSPALMKKHQRILRDMWFKQLISARQYNDYQKWRYEKANYN